MPCSPRLDVPGALHHVMVRGIVRQNIFPNAADVTACLENLLTSVAEEYGMKVTELSGGSWGREVVEVRGVVSCVAVRGAGLGPRGLGRFKRVSRQSILRGVEIGEQVMIKNG